MFSKYSSGEIRMLIDVISYNDELSAASFEKLYEKIRGQSEEGAKYLKDLLQDIGKGYYIVSSKYMPIVLAKLF